ncbi:MAG: hypothetical protein ABIQ45_12995 [Devosia sp.]
MTALLMPMFMVLIGVIFETGMALANYSVSYQIERDACNRATKPTRTMTPDDAVRRSTVLDLFDAMVASAGQKVTSRDATVNWLNLDMTATFTYNTAFVTMLGIPKITYTIDYKCAGIPPYPRDGAVVLDTNFVKPDGSSIPMKYGCWGIYKYNEIGWDAGSGPGTEIQDWRPGCFGSLPATQYPSTYVLELDSDEAVDSNSSITKVFELHPGRYEFSVWYNGRITDTASNIIGVYLQQRRPVVAPEVNLFRLSDGTQKWILFKRTVTVGQYSVYNLTIKAEGTDDTYGGLIYAFNVVYVDTQ